MQTNLSEETLDLLGYAKKASICMLNPIIKEELIFRALIDLEHPLWLIIKNKFGLDENRIKNLISNGLLGNYSDDPNNPDNCKKQNEYFDLANKEAKKDNSYLIEPIHLVRAIFLAKDNDIIKIFRESGILTEVITEELNKVSYSDLVKALKKHVFLRLLKSGGRMKKEFRSLNFVLGVFLLTLGLASAEQVKDGLGKAQLPDSSIYEGNFRNGLFDGKGTLVWRNGNKYVGEFKDGLSNGKGIMVYFTGDQYEGEFKNGLMEGKGICIRRNGDKYEGELKGGYFSGQGILKFAAGGGYEGEFEDSQPMGKGKMSYGDGTVVEGIFKNGMAEGIVTITSRGSKYVGEFKNNLYNGKGTLSYSNGDIFKGNFINGFQEGFGKLVKSNGDKYEGEFKDGVFNGKGILIYSNGAKYEGDFENGEFSGKGKYTYSEGSKYEGGFKKSEYEGDGVLTCPPNCKDCPKQVKRGFWARGKLLIDYDKETTKNRKETNKKTLPVQK